MLLSVKERLVLLQAIPPQTGNLTTLRIVRKLREDLSFSEEEHGELGLRVEGGQITWDGEAQKSKEIEIGEVAHQIIVDNLRALNGREALTEDILDIIDKFPEVEEIEEGE